MLAVATQALPDRADVVVVGGGTAGAVVAGRLAERDDRTVLLLEAGPDYGPLAAGRWPEPLLDARYLPVDDHDWAYVSGARHCEPNLRLDRARVIGGCSSHNGCAAVWGHRLDYDGWAALGHRGWAADDLAPHFEAVRGRLRIRLPSDDEIGPFHAAVLAAGAAAGLPRTDDLDDLDGGIGTCLAPVNTVLDGGRVLRWNAAFGYLDPVRDLSCLQIVGQTLVDRVVVERGRVVGLDVVGPSGPRRVACGEVVLAGGAYGSPAVLLRSGIGPEAHLRQIGIDVIQPLPVGENLHDHPAFAVEYLGTDGLIEALESFARERPLREEGAILKARSSLCREAFDLHIYPFGSPYWRRDGSWSFAVPVATMTPRSRGSLRLQSRDPAASPLIDHGYLTDPEDHDLAVLLDGVDLARKLARTAPLAELLRAEISPGPERLDREELRAWIRGHGAHYYHPVGTCALGGVVDADGRVHGVAGLRVGDASVIPVVPRANTNVPCAVVGERIAAAI
jgi:choline dehydrogenase